MVLVCLHMMIGLVTKNFILKANGNKQIIMLAKVVSVRCTDATKMIDGVRCPRNIASLRALEMER